MPLTITKLIIMRQRRINPGKDINRRLREEFGVSKVTVFSALNYRADSQLCSRIRLRAKTLLEEQLNEVIALLEEEAAL